MSSYTDYIPFDSISDSITLPLEFIKTGWITPSNVNPTVSDLLIYTEDGHSLLLENSNGSWDSEYYSTARLQVVSLHTTPKGFDLLEVGNKECIKKFFNNNLLLIGSTISILDMEEWTSVTLYTKSTNTFYYYTIAINVTHTGSNEQLKDDVKTLGGDTVELDDKINVVFKSNTFKPYVFPTEDTSIHLLWRLLALPDPDSPGNSMAEAMRKNQQFINADGTHKGDDMNHLTWTQYEGTWFFTNKSDVTYYAQWEKLFQMTGAFVPTLSTICPGVAI